MSCLWCEPVQNGRENKGLLLIKSTWRSMKMNLQRLRDQPATNACGVRIAFPSARTGLESLVIREPRNLHPNNRKNE